MMSFVSDEARWPGATESRAVYSTSSLPGNCCCFWRLRWLHENQV